MITHVVLPSDNVRIFRIIVQLLAVLMCAVCIAPCCDSTEIDFSAEGGRMSTKPNLGCRLTRLRKLRHATAISGCGGGPR